MGQFFELPLEIVIYALHMVINGDSNLLNKLNKACERAGVVQCKLHHVCCFQVYVTAWCPDYPCLRGRFCLHCRAWWLHPCITAAEFAASTCMVVPAVDIISVHAAAEIVAEAM